MQPRHLTTAAKRVWKSLQPALAESGRYYDERAESLGLLCEAVGLYHQSKKAVDKLPSVVYQMQNGVWCIHPEEKLRCDREKEMLILMREWGLTPKSAEFLGIAGKLAGQDDKIGGLDD